MVIRRRALPSQTRDHRRRERPYQRQVDALEERVLLDVSSPALRPEPALWILVQKTGNEVPRVALKRAGGRGGREGEWTFYDATQGGLVGWRRKRRSTVNHLVEEDTQGPPVNGVSMGPTGGDLRCHVFVGPNEGA